LRAAKLVVLVLAAKTDLGHQVDPITHINHANHESCQEKRLRRKSLRRLLQSTKN